MYPYLGDFPTGQTIYIPFHTFDSNDPSASVTISGLALADIKVYKDGGVTQRSSTAGFTLLDTDGTDFDGITGIHGISIDTSDNTDAGFWAAGSDYWVVINSITVDAATINFIAATFSIDNRGLLRPTTAQRTLDVAATGEAGIDFGNVTGTLTQANVGWVDANSRVDVGSWLGTAVTLSATTAKPEVDVNSVSDDATAANNLELDYDGTGYNKSNSTIGTCTTNTDMRGTDSALLASSAPTNFSDLAITVTTGQVTVGTNNDKTGYSLTQTFPTNFADMAITATTGQVTVGTNNDKTGYSLTQSFPTNFADLAITATTGRVTVGTNNDKTGYSLTQSFPSNFADLSITASTGRVDVASWVGNAVSFGTGGPDVNVNAISDSTAVPATLELHLASVITGTTSGTPTTTATNTDLTGYADDELIGRVIIFTGGTANGQASDITDYANTSGVVTFTAITTAPASGDPFIIV